MNWAKHVSEFAKDNEMPLGKAMKNKKCKQEWKLKKKRGGFNESDDDTAPVSSGVTESTNPVSSGGESTNPVSSGDESTNTVSSGDESTNPVTTSSGGKRRSRNC